MAALEAKENEDTITDEEREILDKQREAFEAVDGEYREAKAVADAQQRQSAQKDYDMKRM